MLPAIFIRLLNHLLSQETWARDRLRPFAGRTVRMDLSNLSLLAGITDSGLLQARDDLDDTPSVTIHAPSDWPVVSLTDRAALFGQAKISGAVDLAEAFGFVMRNLKWDAESDLSGLVGDIAAHRMVNAGQRFFAWHHQTATRFARNLAEYFVEEDQSIAKADDVAAFCRSVTLVSDESIRLEQRLNALSPR